MATENQTETTELVAQPRVNLLGMSRKNMEAYLSSIGEDRKSVV